MNDENANISAKNFYNGCNTYTTLAPVASLNIIYEAIPLVQLSTTDANSTFEPFIFTNLTAESPTSSESSTSSALTSASTSTSTSASTSASTSTSTSACSLDIIDQLLKICYSIIDQLLILSLNLPCRHIFKCRMSNNLKVD